MAEGSGDHQIFGKMYSHEDIERIKEADLNAESQMEARKLAEYQRQMKGRNPNAMANKAKAAKNRVQKRRRNKRSGNARNRRK